MSQLIERCLLELHPTVSADISLANTIILGSTIANLLLVRCVETAMVR